MRLIYVPGSRFVVFISGLVLVSFLVSSIMLTKT